MPAEHFYIKNGARSHGTKTPRLKIIIPLLAVALLACFFRSSLREKLTERAVLGNDSPTPELVADMIHNAADPRSALLRAWNSKKIIQREVAVDEIRRLFARNQPLPWELRSALLAAALDPDGDVRETALGVLQDRNDPALAALVAAQLRDADPELRLLGLHCLKSVPSSMGIPLAAELLDDPDARVAGTSAKLLENSSGGNFGIKLADTVPAENQATGLLEFSAENLAKTKAATGKARAWWQQHQGEYPPPHLEIPAEASAAQIPLPAIDFKLHSLDGKTVRLSDYRGKVVLLNFFTTWCTACRSEIPELIALQKQHWDQLVVIGVSLDSVPDEDGATGGDSAGIKPDTSKIRDKVMRAVSVDGINYPVLLDEHFEVGGSYNGGELPTTVIVDAQGNIRRRFVGARSLPVFEAMIAEALQPASSGLRPLTLKKTNHSE